MPILLPVGFTVTMVSRARLVRLGATLAEHATTKRVRLLGQLLLLAAIIFVGLRVRSLWHGNHVDLARIEWPSLTGAFLLTAVGVLATGFIWLTILQRLGADPRHRWMAIFFQSQIAKYIPGTLWQYAGRLTLARVRGLPTRVVAKSMPIELGASVVGAGIASLFLLGAWGIPLAAVVAAGSLAVAHRTGGGTTKLRRDISAAAVAAPLYAIVWVAVGSAFWLTAKGLFSVPVAQLPFYTGAFPAAWIVGVVAIYAPGGLGVREGLLIGLLHSRLGSADALVVAAVSRVILTLIDILLAGVATAVLRRDKLPGSDAGARALSLDPRKSVAP